MPAERPFRCLASDREAVDGAAPGQGLDRERRPGCRGAVANRPFIDGFVDVEVDAKSSAVVEDEVPGPIATPGVEAVEPDAHHRPDEMLELLYRHPHIKVRVCSRLFPQQRIDGPPAANHHSDTSGPEDLHGRLSSLSGHLVSMPVRHGDGLLASKDNCPLPPECWPAHSCSFRTAVH